MSKSELNGHSSPGDHSDCSPLLTGDDDEYNSDLQPSPGDSATKRNEYNEERARLSFFSLYRYSTTWEKCLLLTGLLAAAATGVVPAWANFAFGQFTKTLIDYATSEVAHNCPPSNHSGTTPFMAQVEKFVVYQSSLGLFVLVFGYVFVTSLNHVAEKQVYKIRKTYFRKLLQQEIGWFDKNGKRDFSSRMIDDMIKVQNAMSEKLGMLVAGVSNCIFLTALSFVLGWKLTLALLAFIPLLALITGFDARIQATMTSKEQNAYAAAGGIAEEALTNIRTVHAFNGQTSEIERYSKKVDEAKGVAYKKHVLAGIGNGLVWFVSLVNFAYAFWYGSRLVVHSRESGDGLYGPETIIVILYSTLMAGFYFGSASSFNEEVCGGRGAAESIFPVLERVSEINSLSPEGKILSVRPRGHIEFDNVSFSYPTRPELKVLENLSLSIRPGQTVALVGTSGCGKSTVVQLLQRFYDPVAGRILLDGEQISGINLKCLRSQLGVVGQEPVLFNMTIAENIGLGVEKELSRQEIEKVAREAYAHNFIEELPKKYDTLVGERGANLSGGQKQRVAIARALARNPSILLLDEATSALDFQSESIVQAALERARHGRSTLIIAHRLSTIRAADVIYVMDRGKIVEKGAHSELMELQGQYHKLVLSQAEAELERSFLQPESGQSEEVTEEQIYIDQDVVITETSTPMTDLSETYEEENGQGDLSTNGSLFRLWKSNATEWPYILVVLICSTLQGLQVPAYSYIFGDFVESFTIKDDFLLLRQGLYFCFLYIGIGVFMGACGFAQNTFVGFSGEGLTCRIRTFLFASLINQDLNFFDNPKNTVGKLTARLATDAAAVRGATGSRLAGLLQALATLIGAGAMSFYFLPNMAVVTVIFVPAMMFISIIEGRVMHSGNVVERDSIEVACNVAVEALTNVRTVASLCSEERFVEVYEKALEKAHKVNLKRAHVRGLVFGLVNGGPMLCYCVSLWYGGYLVEQTCASIGNVIKVAQALIYCTLSGGAAISYAPAYDKGKIAAARIFQLLDTKPEISLQNSSNTTLGTVSGQVDFDEVNFHYKTRPGVKVLSNLSLNITPGDKIAICGPSGSGKSTCAALIFRFYDPATGSVKFDEFDLRDLSLNFLRQQLALVSQEPILFDCSIKDNITYGSDTNPETDMGDVMMAAKAANMHQFITTLPVGYDTRVGLLGSQMSGGQKQRIAIARAIFRQPKVIILDEATSALDSESEKVVQIALDKASTGRTSVTIAHRLTSIIDANKIFVLKCGEIVESGSHTELLRSDGGIYRQMWEAQTFGQRQNLL